MSEAEAKRARIAEKIAASQARLTRDGPPAPAQRIPADDPPETLGGLVRQHPGLIVAGGLAAGMAAAMLLPRSLRRKLTAQVASLATVAGEIGLALGKQALGKTVSASRETRGKLSDLGGSASQIAGNAAGSARSNGIRLAQKAVEIAKIARR